MGGRSGLELHPEPYKPTLLALTYHDHGRRLADQYWNDTCFILSWHLLVPVDEQVGLRNTNTFKVTICEPTIVVEFGDPGTYAVSVSDTSEQVVHTNVTLRNMYVRRELRALTQGEWEEYVHAVWTLRNVSTADGRDRFVCPTGNQLDYKEYDFFILLHSFHSANSVCDQFHFSMMQEFAHEAWNTLFERALQCVHPSTTLHYWNEMQDRAAFGHTSGMLLSSSVWNATMYGKEVEDEDGAAYVRDGAFAYFPIRQNRTGLCEYLDEQYHERCNAFVEDKYMWRGNKTHTGFFLQSPRHANDYAFVSRRTGYLYGKEDDIAFHTFPKKENIDENILNKSFVDALKYITGDNVHGHAHYWISGLWGNMSVRSALSDKKYTSQDDVDMFRMFVWPLDARGRADGCISCDASACECSADSTERGCWSDNISRPVDSFDVQWHAYDNRSWWFEWLKSSRNLEYRHYLFGCEMMRGGTFDRSATANADPVFYIHHAFTFWLVDRAKRHSSDTQPFYNLEKASEYECPGHRLNDETVFSDLVPYTIGQANGEKHTWKDILFMWSDDRRSVRWE